MKQFKFIIILIFLICQGISYAGTQDSTIHNLTIRGIDLATNLYYEEADSIFDEIIRLDPTNPHGHFMKAAIYFWMFSEDIKNEKIGDKFRDLSYAAVDVAAARLDENDEDIDAMFYLGGAYGSLGRYYAMTRSYLNAYWYGKKGVGYMEDVVELDSTYYDAYLGLGIYHYLADVLPRFVKILSFLFGLEGDKQQGIRELNMTATKGSYTKTEAMFFLGAIYTFREREFEKAIVIFNELLSKYPNNPGAYLSLGRCYSRMGQCSKAIEMYEKILHNKESQSRLPRGSIFYQLGAVYFKMNNFEQAKDNYLRAIASDTAEVGKRRWITPRSQYKVAECYDILGYPDSVKYHLQQINEEESERAYEDAQERLGYTFKEIDILLIKAHNLKRCNNFDESMILLNQIDSSYTDSIDAYYRERLREVNFRKAEIIFEQKFYRDAIIKFDEIIHTNGEEEDWIEYRSYYYMGKSYAELGNYKKAEDSYDVADDTDDNGLLEDIEDARKKLPEDYQ
jgi:tetratricopeptide (TPR) repeat protein